MVCGKEALRNIIGLFRLFFEQRRLADRDAFTRSIEQIVYGRHSSPFTLFVQACRPTYLTYLMGSYTHAVKHFANGSGQIELLHRFHQDCLNRQSLGFVVT